jgi:hypothetical protein
LRNAGDNRTKILDIKKEKAGQESERVSENLQKQEQKRSELDKKIKDGNIILYYIIIIHFYL